jgi:hypothetical protein
MRLSDVCVVASSVKSEVLAANQLDAASASANSTHYILLRLLCTFHACHLHSQGASSRTCTAKARYYEAARRHLLAPCNRIRAARSAPPALSSGAGVSNRGQVG